MVTGYATIQFGTQVLEIRNFQKRLVPGSIKQKVGSKLVRHMVPGRSTRDLEITGNGILFDKAGTTATTARRLLEADYDLEPRHYSDGLTTASMVIDVLSFNDSDANPLHFEYNVRLIQYNQV